MRGIHAKLLSHTKLAFCCLEEKSWVFPSRICAMAVQVLHVGVPTGCWYFAQTLPQPRLFSSDFDGLGAGSSAVLKQEGEGGGHRALPSSYNSLACFAPCAINHWGSGLRLARGPGREPGSSYLSPMKAHLRLNLFLHFPIHS